MKKLISLFLLITVFGVITQSCNDGVTYAEQQAAEKKLIRKYIADNNIKEISQEEFEKDTVTNVAENEYVLFSNGVYMQIVDRGDGDTIRTRDEILVRYAEVDIETGTETFASNYDFANYVDAFYYTEYGTSIYGQFSETWLVSSYYYYLGYTMSTAVPEAWLIPLKYIKDNAHVKLIVPHKVGHEYAQYYVTPFFYDIRKYQIR
ncbi:DUF4827 domain-containing protein [Bacteroides sp. 214]|uniref:DUF4827 domain-containing protein n=1 Tax=Bacteroides sp. 214 TaxID=2302935 RepID=UPI0013D214F7|nr:DUF4827 domain-containing protein [Bacteroides sp. 214]NDW11702.1 DUF4827 domain-containing protein [Bacteroides sp. 214]